MIAPFLRTCLVAGVLALSPVVALAKSYPIPNGNPVAVVTIPDSWEVDETKVGVEVESEDEEMFIAIEAIDMKDAAQAIAESIIWLKKKGVEVDRDSQKRSSFELNGMQAEEVKWEGRDEDGPTRVSLTLVQITEARGLVLTYWSSPAGEKANVEDFMKIAKSLKPVR